VSGVLLLNALGRPEPSPEVSRRLTAIHAGLSLRWIPGAGEHWAVCMAWQPEDGRWQYVQNGSYDAHLTYDIIGYLPMTCGPDEAAPYLERSFRTFPREDIQRMSDAMENWNTGNIQQALDAAIGEVLDSPDPSLGMDAPRKRGRPRKVS
jgi:hypothetical protein